MLIKDLLKNEPIDDKEFLSIDIGNITHDRTKADSNSLLFLLPGVNFDTYELIPEYIAAAPRAIVTENKSLFRKCKIPVIEVSCARVAYAYACAEINKINFGCMQFIGVTGTNGKTSVATLIDSILRYHGLKTGFIGTGKIVSNNKILTDFKYSMTCPDPDLLYGSIAKMQSDGCEAVIMEVSSHALELHKTDPIPFSIGIFTGLSHDHLEFHGSMEKYFHSKEKLIASSKEAIINFDDPWGKRLYEKYKHKSTGIGIVWRSDRNATDLDNRGLRGIGYVFKSANFLTRIDLNIPGMHNVYNSMLAFETAYKMNVPPKVAKEALRLSNLIEGRCECIRSDITVVIDYAHTPEALNSLLQTVRTDIPHGSKIWLVFGCGGDRDKTKRPLMAEVAEKYADKIIVTNDNPRNESEEIIIKELISGFKNTDYSVIYDRESAIRYAIAKAGPSDIVVVAGKGHEKYVIDKDGYHPFNERSIIDSALKNREEIKNE